MWTVIPMSNAQWSSLQEDFKRQSDAVEKYIKLQEMLLEENEKGNLPESIFNKYYEIVKG